MFYVHAALPIGPLPSLFKLWPRGQKWLLHSGQFFTGFYRKNKKSCLKPQVLEP